jgi:hypothetical protein
MTIRPSSALTALVLAAVTAASLTACGGGDSTSAQAAVPSTSPIAAVAQDTSPLTPGLVRASFEGAFAGTFTPSGTADCDLDDEYGVTVNGNVDGAPTELDISFLSYKTPGTVELKSSSVTFDVGQSEARKDWRNQGIGLGEGVVTYNPDGRTGSFDVTLPEISYETAATLPDAPKLHLAGRWSCGPDSSSS